MEPTSPPSAARSRAEAEAARDAWFNRERLNLTNRLNEEPRKSAENYSTNRLTIPAAPRIFNHMVEHQLDATFHALSHPTRRGMLANLSLGEKSIGELAEPFAMSFEGASKHIRVLESAGLVARRKQGRAHICTLNAGPIGEATQWLAQWQRFWTARLDRLEALIAEDKQRG
jgi:DNA-binding transcriptional ArsR family regulator